MQLFTRLRQWRFQYRLRTLLILVFLANLGMSWIAVKMYKANRQRKAVEAIHKLNGTVRYADASGDPPPVRSAPRSPTPQFVQNLLGEDFFAEVFFVALRETEAVDADLACLKELPNLEHLYLDHTGITDAGLEHVKTLRRLKVLDLEGTKVTGRRFDALANLACLETLYLTGSELDDAGLALLQHQGLPRLCCLYIWKTKVTNAGLKHLKNMAALKHLSLGNEITNAGLGHLKDIPHLQRLFLSGIDISDKGLEELKKLTHLEHLSLGITMISPEGLEELRKTLPHCEIDDGVTSW